MSAYGDISCDLCGARFFELDSHRCDDSAIREQVATLRTRVERAEADVVNWAVRYDGLHDVLSAAERQLVAAQSTIAELEATVERLMPAWRCLSWLMAEYPDIGELVYKRYPDIDRAALGE